jgi:hypothetical protein
MGYTFDQYLEALQIAAAAARYSLDRFDLPWRNTPAAPGTTTDVFDVSGAMPPGAPPRDNAGQTTNGEALFKVSSISSLPPPEHRWHPGHLLFRSIDDTDRALLVLLVGETATSGVQQTALREALERVAEFSPETKPIVIVGPSFSGSAPTLKNAIAAWRQTSDNHTARVVLLGSGATAETVKTTLDEVKTTLDEKECSSTCFKSLAWPRNSTLKRLNEFLWEHGAKSSNWAMLVETGTAYGAIKKNPSDLSRGDDDSNGPGILVPYPLHVGQVWSAYAQAGLLSDDARKTLNSNARSALSLSFDDAGATRSDVPPVFSPLDTASIADLELSTILASLRREEVQFVGILGSDFHDKLFLARQIRRHMPNVQLYTVLSDLTYVHSQWSRDLVGMWVASSYPLASDTQRSPERQSEENKRSEKRVSFPSHAAEAAYNALIAALVETADEPAQQRFLTEQLVDYDVTSEGSGPALWISAVGNGEYWPLERHPVQDPFDRQFLWAPSQKSVRPVGYRASAWPFSSCLLLVCWGVAIAGSILLTISTGASMLGRRVPTLQWLLGPGGTGSYRWLLRAGWFTALLPPYLYALWIAAPGMNWSGVEWSHAGFLQSFPTMLLVILLLPLLALVLPDFAPNPTVLPLVPTPQPVHALTSVIAVPLVSLIVLLLGSSDVFRMSRAIHLGSGLSPLLPSFLLAACGLLVLWTEARRQRLLEFSGKVSAIAQGAETQALMNQVRAWLGEWPGTLWSRVIPWLVGTVAMVLALIVFRWHRIRTIDFGPLPLPQGWRPIAAWDDIFIVVFALLVGILAAMGARFYAVWERLRLLLRALSTTPLLYAFDRLPRQLANAVGLRLSRGPAQLSDLRYSVDQLALLFRGAPLPPRPIQVLADRVSATFARESAKAATSAAPTFAFESETQHLLADTAGALLVDLETVWAADPLRSMPSGEPLGPAVVAKDEKVDALQRHQTRIHDAVDFQVRLAEEFVATEVTRYCGYAFTHLKNLLTGATAGSILLLFAIASYPFQPQQTLLRFVIGGMLTLMGIFLVVLLQTDRNGVLSRAADRTPNKLDFDATFLTQLMTFIGIPLLTLLVTQFPAFDELLQRLRGN